MHPLDHPAIAITLTMIIITLCYIVACWIWPFSACRHCAGAGKQRSPSGRAFRYCRHCKSTGGRLRIGRKLSNLLHRLYTEGR